MHTTAHGISYLIAVDLVTVIINNHSKSKLLIMKMTFSVTVSEKADIFCQVYVNLPIFYASVASAY